MEDINESWNYEDLAHIFFRLNSYNTDESGCTILCMLSQVQPYIDRSPRLPYSKDIEQNCRHTTRENCERNPAKHYKMEHLWWVISSSFCLIFPAFCCIILQSFHIINSSRDIGIKSIDQWDIRGIFPTRNGPSEIDSVTSSNRRIWLAKRWINYVD